MESIKDKLATARRMLSSNVLDKNGYAELESFVLKSGSRLGSDPDFKTLKEVLGEIAHMHDFPDIASLQENFGANSCAQ